MKIARFRDGDERPVSYGLGRIWSEGDNLEQVGSRAILSHLSWKAWRNFKVSPLTSLLTIVTISVALLLFASFVLLVENIKEMVASTRTELTLNLYLHDSADDEAVEKLEAEIKEFKEVDQVTHHDKTEALREFRTSLGDQASLLDGLEAQNPLPASLEVRFRKEDASEEVFERFANRYADNPYVETVQYSQGLLGKFMTLLRFFRLGGVVATLFVLLITGFIIANTIKLALYSHREEIEIMRLVGATDSYIRAPFLIEGFVQGTIGALISLFLLFILYLVVRNMLFSSQLLQVIFPEIHFLSIYSIGIVLFSGILVGFLGSYLALRKGEWE